MGCKDIRIIKILVCGKNSIPLVSFNILKSERRFYIFGNFKSTKKEKFGKG